MLLSMVVVPAVPLPVGVVGVADVVEVVAGVAGAVARGWCHKKCPRILFIHPDT